jgi:diacylglycerol kinase family enzyme
VRAFLILNPRSGSGDPEPLLEAAAARGVETHVLRTSDALPDVARAAEADAIGMAGGDGSLAAVAAVAIERELPFVCVPFGTRNHFARDLGLDRNDPVAALDAFTDGIERRVDVGRVGDRLFLNNVSLGVYAQLVHRRERHRRRRDTLARLRALAAIARHPHTLGLTVEGSAVRARIVLVSNNAYDLELLSVGERKRLDEGRLHVYTSADLVRQNWEERDFERLTIDARPRRLPAAVDGEPDTLPTPLEFRLERLALRVLVPRQEDEG